MDHLCRILCGSDVGEGEAFDVLKQVRKSIFAFGTKIDTLLDPKHGNDLTLLGPYCARVLMETGCSAIVGRLDPFRILYLSQFQARSGYDSTKKAKSAFAWQGDVLSPEKEDLWSSSVETQKISRALLSAYFDHVHWRPAVTAALDYAGDLSPNTATKSLLLIEADDFVAQCKGNGNRLYSQLSKGVHWEFFSRVSVGLDEFTARDLIKDAVKWVSRIALMSHFIPTAHCRLSAAEAFQSFSDVSEWIDV